MVPNIGCYLYSYLEVLENNSDVDRNETLGQFINSNGYSELFQNAYLVSQLLYNSRVSFVSIS